ncbi:MAG: hypothetical protein ACRCSF_01760 [Mycobacteriaceae bacterium]
MTIHENFYRLIQEHSVKLAQVQGGLEVHNALLEKKISQLNAIPAVPAVTVVVEPLKSPSRRRMDDDDDDELRFKPKNWFT